MVNLLHISIGAGGLLANSNAVGKQLLQVHGMPFAHAAGNGVDDDDHLTFVVKVFGRYARRKIIVVVAQGV